MRLHFLMSISVVFTHPGLRKESRLHILHGSHSLWVHRRGEAEGCVWTAHHRPVDVPEGSLLAVQDLPLGFIFLPVDPAGEISRYENCSSFAVISAV